jgi:hypothetical protein
MSQRAKYFSMAATKRQNTRTVVAGNVDERVETFALAQRLDDLGVKTFDTELDETE